MSVTKSTSKRGVLLALETGSYGSGAPALVPSTDGFKAYEHFEISPGYQFDGMRDGTPGTGSATMAPVSPSGRKGMVDLVHYFKGAGTGYTASARSTVDRILRGMGMSATLSGGVGTEKITYLPVVIDGLLTSLVGEFYTRGQKTNLKGAYVHKLVIEAKGLVVPKWTASLAGIMASEPTDAAVPAITYVGSALKNPKATNLGLALSVGGQSYTPKLREFTITLERELAELTNENDAAGGHGGHHIGDWKAALDLLFDATAAVTGSPNVSATAFDPYRVFSNARDVGTSLLIAGGGAQYNRVKFNFPTCHLVGDLQEERDGPAALWGVSLQADPSTDDGLDNFSIETD